MGVLLMGIKATVPVPAVSAKTHWAECLYKVDSETRVQVLVWLLGGLEEL